MRYESRAYGTRQEIVDLITQSALTPGRSDRRMQEAARAVVLLEDGADEVWFGHTTYVVTEDTA
ncbi:hypothetical protein [Actinophytocola sp. NPDC049390]|uniref:hypothetical protein n=1 Tax=Actinophytocola sp. NPDC049390 TaxID=3363894 RepID=UPI0037A916F1